MDGSRVYRVGSFAYLFVAFTILFTFVGLLAVLPDAVRNPDNRVFDAIWLAVLGWFCFNILRSPYEARLGPDGRVAFRGLVRRVVLDATAIREIRGLGLNAGIRIEHASGRLWLRVPFTENFDFLTQIRQLNPSVEIRGI